MKYQFFTILTFCCSLNIFSQFTDSNLPIVLIETENGAVIPDDPRVFGTLKIIKRPDGTRNFITDVDNDEFIDYSGTISIEVRGSSSQTLDKKPYGFTTLSDDRSENDNVTLLGMAKENDWILNSFAFDDSMMRDVISYQMARDMGQYATNLKYCEVVLNNEYIGLYALSEKIKIDGDRVDIEKLSDDENSLPEVSGGYIVQTDRPTTEDPEAWNNNGAGYIIEKPNADDITNEQAAYIETVFRSLDQKATNHNIINGYPSVIDVPSFIDYMLMAEISSNADAYALSTFYHKDRSGKLRAGPIWDYNLTYGNDLFQWGYDRSLTNVWQFQYSNVGANFWTNLFNNNTFKCYLSKRFNELKADNKSFNYNYISNLIDTNVTLISEAVTRESQKWNQIDDFSAEITNMKNWFQQRLTWMENNLGEFTGCNNVTIPSLVISKIDYNPQETEIYTESDDLEFIEIKNTGATSVDLTGVYLLKLGVSYQFPVNSSIDANSSIYLASDNTTFANRYSFNPFDTFERNLSNKSHHLVLADAFGNVIDEVKYLDKAPWPETADGDGDYLELIDVASNNALASNWQASSDRVLNTNFENNELVFKVYPNPTKNILIINSKHKLHKVAILNLLGQQLKSFDVNFKSTEISISSFRKGVYFLRVSFHNGSHVLTKIVKE